MKQPTHRLLLRMSWMLVLPQLYFVYGYIIVFYCKYIIEMVDILEDMDLVIYHCKLPLIPSNAVTDFFFFFYLTGIGVRDVLKKNKYNSCKYCMSIALTISSSRQLSFVVVADVEIRFQPHFLIVGRCMLLNVHPVCFRFLWCRPM